LRRKWRDEDNEHAKDLVQMAREIAEMRSQRDELRRLAKEATNRWALLYARTEKEHREVSRLHRDIDAVTTSKAEPAPMWGGYPLTWGDEE
jgi:hypothetical protein